MNIVDNEHTVTGRIQIVWLSRRATPTNVGKKPDLSQLGRDQVLLRVAQPQGAGTGEALATASTRHPALVVLGIGAQARLGAAGGDGGSVLRGPGW